MASPAEQIIDNTSWTRLFKRVQTWKILGFVVLSAFVLRLGSFIPLPGVDNNVWSQFWSQSPFAKMFGLL